MATIYINADTGDDSRTYEQAQVSTTPWETFSKANTSGVSGDTVYLQDATTYYILVVNITKSFTIIGESVSGVFLSLAGSIYNYNNLRIANQSMIIKNLTIDRHSSGWNIAAENVYFEYDKCHIQGVNFPSYGHINLDDGGGGTVLVRNCLIEGSTANLSTTGGFISSPYKHTYDGVVSLYNNVFNYSGLYTDNVFGNPLNNDTTLSVNIKNNIFYNAGVASVQVYELTNIEEYIFENNCTYNMSAVPTGDNNITDDPLFVDVDADNFELQLDSPCISAGTLI